MLKLLTTFAFLSISFAAFSQDTNAKSDTITKYFTDKWIEVPDKSQAYYYDKYIFQDSVWFFKEFYMSGKLHADGGYFKEYKFLDNKFSKQCGKITMFFENGKVKEIHNRVNGFDIGEQKYFKEDGSESIVEQAEFIGGAIAMYKFLQEHIKYPSQAQRKNIEGIVYVKFNICDDGTLCNYEVLKSPNELLSDETIRVISTMPKWKPMIRDGKNIETDFTMPVVFHLTR